ncbi:MAG TPA: CvpA family protein [Candidatus Methylomirabilis sp.]|nr:CvpA family protein [Candidatus Methylomirabilis sp.]
MGNWNWLDGVLVVIILLSAYWAMVKGFVAELISLAALVAGLVVAALRYRQVALYFEDLTHSHDVALAAGFLVLFLGVLILGGIVSALAHKLVKTAGLSGFDRLIGGMFGLVRGVLVDSIVLMVLVAFAIKPAAVQASTLAPYITTGARAVALVMPTELRDQFRAGFEKFRQAMAEADKALKKN